VTLGAGVDGFVARLVVFDPCAQAGVVAASGRKAIMAASAISLTIARKVCVIFFSSGRLMIDKKLLFNIVKILNRKNKAKTVLIHIIFLSQSVNILPLLF
jgi:hypothetical protein